VKVLGGPEDFAVQTEGLLAVGGEDPGGRDLGDPDVGRHGVCVSVSVYAYAFVLFVCSMQ